MKILLVDDSTAMRRLILRALRQAGLTSHEFVEAANGAEGLEVVRKDSPDIVLSDWNMPEMNGYEFLTALRAEGFGMPFGFITTEGSAEMREKALSGGANFLLAKPFTPDQVEETIGRFID